MSEFEGRVGPDGRILVPKAALEGVGLSAGARVHIRLTSRAIAGTLRSRGITDDEVDGISRLQIEARERVIALLLSEGALRKQAARLLRKRS